MVSKCQSGLGYKDLSTSALLPTSQVPRHISNQGPPKLTEVGVQPMTSGFSFPLEYPLSDEQRPKSRNGCKTNARVALVAVH